MNRLIAALSLGSPFGATDTRARPSGARHWLTSLGGSDSMLTGWGCNKFAHLLEGCDKTGDEHLLGLGPP